MRIYQPAESDNTDPHGQPKPAARHERPQPRLSEIADPAEELSEVENVVQTAFLLTQRASRKAA